MQFTIVVFSTILGLAAALPSANSAPVTFGKRWECEPTPLCAFECTRQREAFDTCNCMLLTCMGGSDWQAKKRALDNCCEENTTLEVRYLR